MQKSGHGKGSVELHIFAHGYHGFGMKKQNLLTDQWMQLFTSWLAVQGYLSPART